MNDDRNDNYQDVYDHNAEANQDISQPRSASKYATRAEKARQSKVGSEQEDTEHEDGDQLGRVLAGHFFSPEADPNVHAGDGEGDDDAEEVEEDARQGGVSDHEEAKDVKEDHLNIIAVIIRGVMDIFVLATTSDVS